MPSKSNAKPAQDDADCSTFEAAKRLGLAVRSVQLMVDRGELRAWKTAGGHRRIARSSVDRWLEKRFAEGTGSAERPAAAAAPGRRRVPAGRSRAVQKVLLIEDSTHFLNLISLLLQQHFPAVELRVATDGIAGLVMIGQWQPDVLIVDILLPGIDGATLITSLRTQPQFGQSRLLVVTSLDERQREPYAFALVGVPVIHKPRLVFELPSALALALDGTGQARP